MHFFLSLIVFFLFYVTNALIESLIVYFHLHLRKQRGGLCWCVSLSGLSLFDVWPLLLFTDDRAFHIQFHLCRNGKWRKVRDWRQSVWKDRRRMWPIGPRRPVDGIGRALDRLMHLGWGTCGNTANYERRIGTARTWKRAAHWMAWRSWEFSAWNGSQS